MVFAGAGGDIVVVAGLRRVVLSHAVLGYFRQWSAALWCKNQPFGALPLGHPWISHII
jgi:hypothetical protein